MKTSAVAAAISAGFAAAAMLPTPPNFPACGTTCLNGVLGQASDLGCGGGGSTADAVDGACLCKNINFLYGIIDCANAVCPDGVAQTVVQYGVDWCAAQGVIVSGLSATPDPSVVSSPTVTVSATATAGDGSSDSTTASVSATVSEIISTITNSDGSAVPTTVGTVTLPNGGSESSGSGGVVIPISTTEIVSTVTNSDGAVVTTTLSTSVIYQTGTGSSSAAETGSSSGSESASESTLATESATATGGSTETTGATATDAATSTDGAATTTSSDNGARQTIAPVGLFAAAGLAALML
ncbi:hypothetical protein O1611_g2530 [Lasiodiplodia mahajangana]|uniref:Uncharacterized protein n=1 Tax=Lasiodiplodia mahajangana TaxID=1108764 RepID=A0ACC2JV61_9PEZI|nr:hypothetical protein O1611_g2530 [Lasiodiplodia mahajangana]